MHPHIPLWQRLGLPAALIFLAGWVGSTSAATLPSSRLKELRAQAEFHERQADWDKACEVYEGILRLDRGLKEIKDRLQHCQRRGDQVRRHRDYSYRKEVLSLELGRALRLYNLIVETLLENSIERRKTDAGRLFRKGLEELRWALDDPVFVETYLPAAKEADLRTFKNYLAKWGSMKIPNRAEAVKQAREVAMAAYHHLQLDATTVVMEFTCGACYAIDNFTAYLTPSQLRELCETLRGFVGVGLTLSVNGNRLVIADVTPGSPADVMPALKGERLLSVDKKPVMTPELALELLEGPTGSMVELVVESPLGETRTIALRRRPILVPSVRWAVLTETPDKKPLPPIGYLQIAGFQDTTLQELDDALVFLGKSDMKVLILDLRGNPGGLFEAAIEAARRFLSAGVITSTQNSDPKFNIVYQARNAMPLGVPVVVLIDGNTASAAEVLAGALKENHRARLVGQTTYGKGCTQTLVKLPPGPGGLPTGGLRITVTRFFSPTGHPYSGKGVAPHLVVERFPMTGMMDVDHQYETALAEALRLLEK